jgi:hypothetical protein
MSPNEAAKGHEGSHDGARAYQGRPRVWQFDCPWRAQQLAEMALYTPENIQVPKYT